MYQEKVEPQGWLTFAQNSDTVNYVNQAYLLALSIKLTCSINKFAVVVDDASAETLTDKQRGVFDYIKVVPKSSNPYALECQALDLTPFKETFKVESDVLIPRNLDHWWHGCRNQDVVLTGIVRDYQGRPSNTRAYRKFFDVNRLDDIYNGFMYFRLSRPSAEFFKLSKRIVENYNNLGTSVLAGNVYSVPDTDVIFSIASTISKFGNSNIGFTTKIGYPTFTHMKGAVNGWHPNMDWRDAVPWTLTKDMDLILGGFAQHYPFHYYQKDFCTEDLIERYERRLGL
jgi:hypothetical protein